MATIADQTDAIEDQVFEAVKQGQDAIVKAVRTWAEAAENLLPDLTSVPDLPNLPMADQLPSVSEIVDSSFAFADKLIASQREFAAAVLEAAKPLYGAVNKSADAAAEKLKTGNAGTSVSV